MASPTRATREELEKMVLQMQADMQVFKRKSEVLDTMMSPVLYLMRAGRDAATYVVGNAESLKAMPAPPSGKADAEGVYYKILEVGENAASLAAELERCLAQFKAGSGVGTGESYAVPFEEGKMWLDFVVGRAMVEGITDGALRQEGLRRLINVYDVIKSAKEGRGLARESVEGIKGIAGGAAGSIGSSADGGATGAKKTKNEKIADERAKIARFVGERCVLDADAPLVKKNEVLCMYRIWGKGTSFYTNTTLVDYMDEEMNVKTDHIGPTKDGVVAFKGISLKKDDWKYDVAGNEPVKRFFREMCNFTPTAKVFSRTLHEEYIKWREEKGLGALSQTDLKRDIRGQLKDCPIVYGTSIAIGDESATGWYGVGMIGVAEEEASTPTPSPVRKATFNPAKVVERRMPGEGGKVLESWPSVAQAAKSLGIANHTVQSYIRKQKPDAEGAIFAFAQKEAGGAGTSGASSEKGDE